MIIKPSTLLRNNYASVSKLCKDSKEPVYLTKNGEGDLVIMDIDVFVAREETLAYREDAVNVREKLLEALIEDASGCKTYSIEEVEQILQERIDGAS